MAWAPHSGQTSSWTIVSLSMIGHERVKLCPQPGQWSGTSSCGIVASLSLFSLFWSMSG